MCKLTSKLCKNINNTEISLYQIPKLHENILKCQRLDLFKKNATGFNHALQTSLKSPASLSDCLFV